MLFMYFKQSTIVNSLNGCAGVIQTNNALIADNFCFNFQKSGFVVDTGSETGNTFDSNLAIASVYLFNIVILILMITFRSHQAITQ